MQQNNQSKKGIYFNPYDLEKFLKNVKVIDEQIPIKEILI